MDTGVWFKPAGVATQDGVLLPHSLLGRCDRDQVAF